MGYSAIALSAVQAELRDVAVGTLKPLNRHDVVFNDNSTSRQYTTL
jgi:hypothetical protein